MRTNVQFSIFIRKNDRSVLLERRRVTAQLTDRFRKTTFPLTTMKIADPFELSNITLPVKPHIITFLVQTCTIDLLFKIENNESTLSFEPR